MAGSVMWFQSRGVTPQEGGPFGYGYRVRLPAPAAAAAGSGPTLVPFAFYFGWLWKRANGTVDQAYTVVQYFQDSGLAGQAAGRECLGLAAIVQHRGGVHQLLVTLIRAL
jgi:hypothetical protein